MERLRRTGSGLHRIGDHYGNFIDSDHFLGRDPYGDTWMSEQKPLANIYKDKKVYDLEIALPGFKREEINIHLDKDILEITAEKADHQYKEKEPYYIRREYATPAFARSFKIPENVKDDQIEAVYEGGILKVRLPHDEEEKDSKREQSIKVE